MNRCRSEQGQAMVLTVIFVAALLGALGLVLDVGSWFREQRAAQSAADAAALAGAQALPHSTATSSGLAASYFAQNGGGEADYTFSGGSLANDTITVEVTREAESVFAKLFGIESVDVHARASARALGMAEAKYVAPIVVHVNHPQLNCGTFNGRPSPCFNQSTSIQLHHLHQPGGGDASGSFGLINLIPGAGGPASPDQLGDWIRHGYDDYMPLGQYRSTVSTRFNSTQVQSALEARRGKILLFPIYSKIVGPGSNAEYTVVGWVGFRLTDFQISGQGKLYGHFTQVVWDGLPPTGGGGDNLNYGARTVRLVE